MDGASPCNVLVQPEVDGRLVHPVDVLLDAGCHQPITEVPLLML